MPKGEGPDYWAQEACRHLRYDKGAAQALLDAFEEGLVSSRALSPATREALQKTTPYFRNNVRGWTTRRMKRPGSRWAAG